jgi:hypothetical protein
VRVMTLARSRTNRTKLPSASVSAKIWLSYRL